MNEKHRALVEKDPSLDDFISSFADPNGPAVIVPSHGHTFPLPVDDVRSISSLRSIRAISPAPERICHRLGHAPSVRSGQVHPMTTASDHFQPAD